MKLSRRDREAETGGDSLVAEPEVDVAVAPPIDEEPLHELAIWDDAPTLAPVVGNVRPPTMPELDRDNLDRMAMCSADGGKIGPWWLSAASIVGAAHHASARTRQDDYSFGLLEDDSLVAVVADGLGSHPRTSQIGATLMSRAVVTTMRQLSGDASIDHLLSRAVLNAQQLVVERGLQEYQLQPKDLSCTIVACWLRPGLPAKFVRVGDADAFTSVSDDRRFQGVFAGGEDPFVNIVRASCPSAPAEAIEVATCDSYELVVLSSDGLAIDIEHSPAIREHLCRAWIRPTSAAAMLESLRYRRQGSHDDRTGLLIWRIKSKGGSTQ